MTPSTLEQIRHQKEMFLDLLLPMVHLNSDKGYYSFCLSASEDVAAIGDPYCEGSSGMVYVFKKKDSNWSLFQEIKLSLPEASDSFGSSLSMSYDGRCLMIGAQGTQDERGSVHFYEVFSDTYRVVSVVTHELCDCGSLFGSEVSMSADGSTAAVSARGFKNFTGAVFVYKLKKESWVCHSAIGLNAPLRQVQFGICLKTNHDGSSIVVGNIDDEFIEFNLDSYNQYSAVLTDSPKADKLKKKLKKLSKKLKKLSKSL